MPRPCKREVTLAVWQSGSHHVRACGVVPAIARHAHRHICLTTVRGGRLEFGFANGSTCVEEGQTLIIAAGVPHDCRSYAHSGAYAGADIVQVSLCVDTAALSVSGALLVQNAGLSEALLHVQATSEQAVLEQARIWCDPGMAETITGASVPEFRAVPPDVRRCLRALAHIVPGEESPVPQWTEHVALPQRGLARRFCRHVGMPPYAWQMVQRIRLGAAHLAQGAPLTDAALSAGFYDLSHFTRHFNRIMGMTPGQYAAAFVREL